MEADKVRALLVNVRVLRAWLDGEVGEPGQEEAVDALNAIERKLGTELPPARGTFAGALNGATLKTR